LPALTLPCRHRVAARGDLAIALGFAAEAELFGDAAGALATPGGPSGVRGDAALDEARAGAVCRCGDELVDEADGPGGSSS